MIRRKHTVKAMRELPALLADTVRPLQDQRASQNQRLELADHAILDLIDFDPLGERAKVIAAVAAAIAPHALAGGPGKCLESLRCDRRSATFNRILGPLSVKAGLVARGLQFSDAVLQHGIGEIGDAVPDRIVEPLEFWRLPRPPACAIRRCAPFAARRVISGTSAKSLEGEVHFDKKHRF